MAYLVKCPHCQHPKRIDIENYDPKLKGYAYKFPDGAMYVGPGPKMYRCPECNEQYAVGATPIEPSTPKTVPAPIEIGPAVWPWGGGSIPIT